MDLKLINGDCMEYMKTVPDKYFDLAATDPPYFSGPRSTFLTDKNEAKNAPA